MRNILWLILPPLSLAIARRFGQAAVNLLVWGYGIYEIWWLVIVAIIHALIVHSWVVVAKDKDLGDSIQMAPPARKSERYGDAETDRLFEVLQDSAKIALTSEVRNTAESRYSLAMEIIGELATRNLQGRPAGSLAQTFSTLSAD